jgi:hypothetical protein
MKRVGSSTAIKTFTGRFIADGMLLLKGPLDEKKYQVSTAIRVSEFTGDNESREICLCKNVFSPLSLIASLPSYVEGKLLLS